MKLSPATIPIPCSKLSTKADCLLIMVLQQPEIEGTRKLIEKLATDDKSLLKGHSRIILGLLFSTL